MLNSECIEMFEKYLREEKKSSSNTLSSDLRDIRQFGAYLDLHTDTDIVSATEDELSEYINWLKGQGKSVATVSRCIASLKCLYSYLTIRQIIAENPATKLVPDKGEHKLPQILTSQEVDLLLEQPECIDAKGYRDKAMLELLYATGIRVTELINLDITDINLAAGVIRCSTRDKERLIPMYAKAVKALSDYVTLVRPQMIALPDEPPGLLEADQILWGEGGDPDRDHPPHPAPLLCRPPVGKRCRYPRHPGDAGPRGYLLHPGIHPAGQKAAEGCLQQGPSPCLNRSLTPASEDAGVVFGCHHVRFMIQ